MDVIGRRRQKPERNGKEEEEKEKEGWVFGQWWKWQRHLRLQMDQGKSKKNQLSTLKRHGPFHTESQRVVAGTIMETNENPGMSQRNLLYYSLNL